MFCLLSKEALIGQAQLSVSVRGERSVTNFLLCRRPPLFLTSSSADLQIKG